MAGEDVECGAASHELQQRASRLSAGTTEQRRRGQALQQEEQQLQGGRLPDKAPQAGSAGGPPPALHLSREEVRAGSQVLSAARELLTYPSSTTSGSSSSRGAGARSTGTSSGSGSGGSSGAGQPQGAPQGAGQGGRLGSTDEAAQQGWQGVQEEEEQQVGEARPREQPSREGVQLREQQQQHTAVHEEVTPLPQAPAWPMLAWDIIPDSASSGRGGDLPDTMLEEEEEEEEEKEEGGSLPPTQRQEGASGPPSPLLPPAAAVVVVAAAAAAVSPEPAAQAAADPARPTAAPDASPCAAQPDIEIVLSDTTDTSGGASEGGGEEGGAGGMSPMAVEPAAPPGGRAGVQMLGGAGQQGSPPEQHEELHQEETAAKEAWEQREEHGGQQQQQGDEEEKGAMEAEQEGQLGVSGSGQAGQLGSGVPRQQQPGWEDRAVVAPVDGWWVRGAEDASLVSRCALWPLSPSLPADLVWGGKGGGWGCWCGGAWSSPCLAQSKATAGLWSLSLKGRLLCVPAWPQCLRARCRPVVFSCPCLGAKTRGAAGAGAAAGGQERKRRKGMRRGRRAAILRAREGQRRKAPLLTTAAVAVAAVAVAAVAAAMIGAKGTHNTSCGSTGHPPPRWAGTCLVEQGPTGGGGDCLPAGGRSHPTHQITSSHLTSPRHSLKSNLQCPSLLDACALASAPCLLHLQAHPHAVLPPPCCCPLLQEELAASVWDHGLLPVLATQPHYGQPQHRPPRPTVFANQEFRCGCGPKGAGGMPGLGWVAVVVVVVVDERGGAKGPAPVDSVALPCRALG